MGKMSYPFLPFTLESIRWNGPSVHHVLINIVEGPHQSSDLIKLVGDMGIDNYEVKVMDIAEWTARVKQRLGIDVPFDMTWFYKSCDYKPTMAHLFPEYSERLDEKGGLYYKYWGYADMDVVWGNFSRFAHWFQGDYPFVISGWFGTTGAAAFYVNNNMSRSIFMNDELFVPLLRNKTYHNLDEGGAQTDAENVFEGGKHAISWIQKTYVTKNDLKFNYGQIWQDHCFYDQGDSLDWAGPVSWVRGVLKVQKGSDYFPPGRELLFYHRPERKFFVPPHIRTPLLHDMFQYGYLLPNWIPLLTRFICKSVSTPNDNVKSMHAYHPYAEDCFGTGVHEHGPDNHKYKELPDTSIIPPPKERRR